MHLRLQREDELAELNDGSFKILAGFLEALNLPGMVLDESEDGGEGRGEERGIGGTVHAGK